MQTTAVIMAGGRGERFWPKSRVALPKQFLSLTNDGKTMLQLTVERLLPVVDIENIFIVTNSSYRKLVAEQLPGLPDENTLCEPTAKNTAPCIAYATAVISARYSDAVMYVMPSDHIIKNSFLFNDILLQAGALAEQNSNLVTLGVTPTYPETGYGYVCFDPVNSVGKAYAVKRFVEKPNLEKAKEYVAAGNYLWNSGMFCWKASTFLGNLESYLPEVFTAAKLIFDAEKAGGANLEAAIKKAFAMCPSVSVDYGIMEKASHIYTIPSSFGWDDVGGWLSLDRFNALDKNGNMMKGNIEQVGCVNTTLLSNGRLVAAIGLENVIVVDTGDAVLVCDKDQTQRVKEIVQKLKDTDRKEYL